MSQGLSRNSFRNIWLLLLVMLLGLALLVFNQGRSARTDIASKNSQLLGLTRELDNAARRSSSLEELDKLTIDEKTATRLDILRHLGLEQTDYAFQVNSRQNRVIGDTTLYLRSVHIEAQVSYADAMALIDRLQETRKIVLTKIEISRSSLTGDKVTVSLDGTIYGLDKHVSCERTRLLIVLAASLLASRGAWAQGVEAEWRAVSDVSQSVVPAYAGAANPFPTRTDAPVQVVDDDTAAAARNKAEALAQARKLINSDRVFRPNVQGLAFDGYISGKNGEKVFSDGKWMGVGDSIPVPVKGAEAAYQTIEDLKSIDKDLATEVEKELSDRLSSSPLVKLRISKIGPKEVIMTSRDGTYKVPVRQGGF